MSKKALKKADSSIGEFIEINSKSNVLLSNGGGDRLLKNTLIVRRKAKELGLTDENLGNI